MNKSTKNQSTSISIDLTDADAWDDTELIKEYEESMKNYRNAHSSNKNEEDYEENMDYMMDQEGDEVEDHYNEEEDDDDDDEVYEIKQQTKKRKQKNKKRKTHDNYYNNNYYYPQDQSWNQYRPNYDYSQYYSYNDGSSSMPLPPPPPPIPMSPFGGDMSGLLWSYYYYGYAMGQYQAFQMLKKNEDN